jgi:hypothetical protein
MATRTTLEIALDAVANVQEIEERLPRRTLVYFALAGVAATLKEIAGQLETDQPKRGKAA